jgi:hypothetical protein
VANSNLGNGILRSETFGPRAVNEPRRRWNGHGRPTIGAASPGNVLLFCRLGNHVNLRGLLGGAEGIRTPDLCSGGARALDGAAASGSVFTLSCGYPIRKKRKLRSALIANGSLTSTQVFGRNAQKPAVHWGLDERIMSTLCCPPSSAQRTGWKRERADFGLRRGVARGAAIPQRRPGSL